MQIKGTYNSTSEKYELSIPSGVTLLIPYGDTTSDRNSGGTATIHYDGASGKSYYTANSSQVATFERISHVILCNGVTLYVDGTLEISGELTGGAGGSPAGHTAGKYSELILEPNAKIVVEGHIKAYGFISNSSESETQNTLVTVNGTISQPFSLIDYKGGSLLKAINEQIGTYKYHPFCQFKFMNISVETRYNSTGKLNGWCNLATGKLIGDGMQQNFKEVTFIGEGYMIEMTSSDSYILSKYDPSTEITDLRIYGGAKNNPMALALSTSLGDVNTSSDQYFFGISWCYNITLDNAPNQDEIAVFEMPYTYKLMPGSKMTIEEGAKLIINTLSIYSSFTDNVYHTDDGARPGRYPDGKDPAILIVRGALEADYLGGDVYADRNGVTVIAKYGTSVVTYEPSNYSGSTLSATVETRQTITTTLKLLYFTDSNDDGTIESSEISYERSDILKNFTYETINEVWVLSAKTAYITIDLPDDVRAVIENVIASINADGTITLSKYDSSAGSSVKVVVGTPITFYLASGQVVASEETMTLNSLSELEALYVNNREFVWNASATGTPTIYDIPVFSLSTGLASDNQIGTISVGSITIGNLKANATPYISIPITATGSQRVGYSEILTVTTTLTIAGASQTGVSLNPSNSSGIFESSKENSSTGSTVTVSLTVTITITADLKEQILATAKSIAELKEQESPDTCVTPDTLVTLADGTQRRIDELTYDDLVLVWNFYTGTYDIARPAALVNHGYSNCEIIKLTFSDGSILKFIGVHGAFSKDYNRFIDISADNCYDYVGTTFLKYTEDGFAEITLVDCDVYTEYTESWTIVTEKHYNAILNGVFTANPSVCAAFPNADVPQLEPYEAFELGENMQYDSAKMQADIEKYGLYTYEEFKDYISYEKFVAWDIATLKVVVGKGYATYEGVINYINIINQFTPDQTTT